jgi:hypothetical protein
MRTAATLALLLVAAAATAAPVPDDLQLRARALRLAEDPAWLRLGHWRHTPVGWQSEADGLPFFLSLRGKESPSAELEVLLARLITPPPADRPADDDPRCRFPARVAFLRARLGDDPRLAPRACPAFDEFRGHLQARSATLVFSSYYLNNPVSSFGHTFLRLNKAEEARSGKHFELLDYGIDYSATPDTSNAVAYALKGLFGGFRGTFRSLAYYYKVREYADAESRDLWEYDLAMSPEEIDLLVGHLWELGHTYFDYWYLDENCSYHILGAVEAVLPRVTLLAHVGTVVIPADTVKALFENPGLVRSVHHRPSIRTQFEARARQLDGPESGLVAALVDDPAVPFPAELPPVRRAAVLDAAVDLVDLRHFRNLAVDAAPEAARTRQALLVRRAGILVQSPALDIAPPRERAPERGHGSFRLGAGGGWSSRDGGLGLLEGRVALHDLADPPDGFPLLSQIEFLPFRLRVLPDDRRAELDEAWPLRIVSLNGLSRFDYRPSWRIKVGGATVRDAACKGCLAAQVEVGSGLTLANLGGFLDVYGGVDLAPEWSPRLDGIDGKEVRVGIGPGGLLRLRLGRFASVLADARWRSLPWATPSRTWDLRGTLRLHVARGASLSFDVRRTPAEDVLTGGVLAYF